MGEAVMEDKLRTLKHRVIDNLELPKEVIIDNPKVTMQGDTEITIENHKGIVTFDNNKMTIRSRLGNIVIEGRDIEILFIGGSTITISGKFKSLVYEGEK